VTVEGERFGREGAVAGVAVAEAAELSAKVEPSRR
jgi:hypothetical protein